MKLLSYDEIDELVDTDPITLRDYAWEVTRRLQDLAPEKA